MPQSSRRPGGGAGSLRPTLDSERSPSVHYANWKETMLLGRQLTTLARTEKALVHGITADQKVVFLLSFTIAIDPRTTRWSPTSYLFFTDIPSMYAYTHVCKYIIIYYICIDIEKHCSTPMGVRSHLNKIDSFFSVKRSIATSTSRLRCFPTA